ncbi:intradiol ring-cleavage dioxygenase [Glycomyces luteolus]|uniref:Intradiol ring-cleavage dioxygenase n=1 Tax=Glycomyces luteolus TaxID=2670330 RepID=A0A9X3PKP8_9ACTN|nr:intradiol ring-cleavage dioxygenase [Glycomyces luteolus]MDA1360365.1 intradiol ring-cleavage dioxygenase [Glycomyces luteolus]
MSKQQAETLRYEGRPYAKQDEELVDQGLLFDIGTLLSRRGVLFAGAGAAVAGLAACGTTDPNATESSSAPDSSGDLAEIPEETAGPYPGDGSNGPDVLEESGIVRSDIRSSFGTGSATAEGVPLTLQFTIYDMANGSVPFEGVAVYAWHCTRDGEYSMYGEGLESENFLRGVQIADADGVVSFTTVYPGCYSGRWPHVHFEVYPDEASITDSANVIATSQLAFPEDVCDTVYAEEGYENSVENLAQISLESDNIFSDDGGESQMGTVSGDVANGYTITLAVGVDTSTEAGGGGSAPSGGGGGAPGGGEMPSGEPPANNG